MKIFLYLFLCVVYSGKSVVGHDDVYYDHHHRDPIERPCQLQDLLCIGRYFDHSSECSGHRPAQRHAHGHAPDRIRINKLNIMLPNINVSGTLYDNDVDGFNDFMIGEFYINKVTNRLVLEVQFRELRLFSSRYEMTFHRKGREALVKADYLSNAYRDLSITLIAPLSKDVKESTSNVYTFIADPTPDLKLGPQLSQSRDPLVSRVMSQIMIRLGLQQQEGFLSSGPILMAMFLQNNICRQ